MNVAAHEPSAEGVGQAIRERRQATGLSQGDLADAAGYGKGGAVSLSRIERGIVRPQAARLAGISHALGVTPQQLWDEAVQRTAELADQRGDSASSLRELIGRTKDWHTSVSERVSGRASETQEKGETFNAAHDAARDGFFMQFVEVANTIQEAPAPQEAVDDEPGVTTAREGARLRIEAMGAGIGSAISGAAVGSLAGAATGGAAAYAAFATAATFGTAGTGAAISGLSGVAATNATLALLGGGTLAAGGAGIAGGTLLLTGMVAAPAAILGVAGFAVLKRHLTKKEDARLRSELETAERALSESQQGYDAMIHVLSEATEVLDYAGLYGTHALRKWQETLPAEPRHWAQLDAPTQARYTDFLTVAGCVLAVSSINVSLLLTAPADELQEMQTAIDVTLAEASQTVRRLV